MKNRSKSTSLIKITTIMKSKTLSRTIKKKTSKMAKETIKLIVCKKALAWDALREVPNIKALLDLMDERESIQKVQADQAKKA